MVSASIRAGRLTLELLGWHKLWAIKSRLEISLSHITEVTVGIFPKDRLRWTDLKLSGTDLPGEFHAGTFRHNGQWVFWDARQDAVSVVTIETDGERYAKIIVEVRNPAALVAAIHDARQP